MTFASIIASALITFCVINFVLGTGTDPTISAMEVMRLGLGIAVGVPAVLCPILIYKMTKLTHDANIARDAYSHLAHTDQLTCLLNRRGFGRSACALLRQASSSGAPCAALIIDIDVFKRFNDDLGHRFGDAALLHVANLLREASAGCSAVLGRLGGDEFAMLLHGVNHHDAVALAEKLRAACAAKPVRMDGLSARLTVSIGAATAVNYNGPLLPLMSAADAELLNAKHQGRNRVIVSERPGETAQAA